MKKILSIVLVALLVCGVAFAATPGYKLSAGIGEIQNNNQGGSASDPIKTFRMVRFIPPSGAGRADVATLTAESIVIWDLVSDDGVTVTTTTTSGDSAVAGVIAQNALTPENVTVIGATAANSIGTRNWTWLQTHGPAQVDMYVSDAVIGAAGWRIGCSTIPGKATGWGLAGTSTSAADRGDAGFAFDAMTTGATDQEVFLQLN